MKIENIPADIKSKSLKEARNEINEILAKLENKSSNLSENELNGFVTSLTKVHFFPYTKVSVPFCLGRTIRGVSFNENILLDPYKHQTCLFPMCGYFLLHCSNISLQ